MIEFFKKTLNVNRKAKDFVFQRTFHGAELRYHVTISKNPEISFFQMKRDGSGYWKMVAQGLPEWIGELELELGNVIRENW